MNYHIGNHKIGQREGQDKGWQVRVLMRRGVGLLLVL
jgi:hypothetical protein